MILFSVYFIFTLDYGNDVRQEANWSGFLFELKMGHKAAETTQNINNAFGPELLPITVQWWFKMFWKGDESLEDEECRGQPVEVDNNQLRTIIKGEPLRAIGEVAEELNIDHSMVIWHLKQIGKVKKLNK